MTVTTSMTPVAVPTSEDTKPQILKPQENIWDPQIITLKVKDGELAVHENILAKGSRYFKKALKGPWLEGQERVFSFTFNDLTAAEMGRFVSLLYQNSLKPTAVPELLNTYKAVEIVRTWHMANYFEDSAVKAESITCLKSRIQTWTLCFTGAAWTLAKKSDKDTRIMLVCNLYKQLTPDINEFSTLRKELVEGCDIQYPKDYM
ncbi:hypothetical protein ACRALDRAFT_1069109 [Sodiomyces alcalophilus JCM 7366]|uniref:uncharacterized protein n=1 Tax=Sodiomyces alcalophilus JCM 7366 TaxID=591952 RepID=UPI0039B420E1